MVRVQAEVQSVSALSPSSSHNCVRPILERVASAVAEEVNRLFCCISRMNSNGCIQAWVDIHCLQASLKTLLTATAEKFLTDAVQPLYDLERPGDRAVIDACTEEFNQRMGRHVAALNAVGQQQKRK